jgi:hypothetical protein
LVGTGIESIIAGCFLGMELQGNPCIGVAGGRRSVAKILLSFRLENLRELDFFVVEGVWRWLVGMAPQRIVGRSTSGQAGVG